MNNRPIRVLHVIPNLKKGGAERIALDICNELVKREGIEVRLVTFAGDNEYRQLSENIRIDVVPSNVSPSLIRKSVVNISSWQHYISDYKPDIIHSHLFEAELITRWKPVPGICYFTHTHSNTPELNNPGGVRPFSKKWLISKFVYRLMLKKYVECRNSFIAISKSTGDYFTRNFPQFRQRIFLLPNAINVTSFAADAHRNLSDTGIIKLISVGGINKNKNQAFQLEVASALKQKSVSFHLDIFGGGPLLEHIRDLVAGLGLKNEVSVHGICDDVKSMLNKSDIFIHTARKEAFGLVMLEAMASGLPVVCLDGGGNRDLMQDGENGFILKNQDATLFAQKILDVCNTPHRYAEMSQNALSTAERYDIKPYVTRLLEIYCKGIKENHKDGQL